MAAIGRPSKGPRKQIVSTRVHPDVVSMVEAEVERLGVHRGDVVAHALCVLFDRPEHDPLRRSLTAENEQLPMTG